MKIPKTKNHQIPEGNHKAILRDVLQYEKVHKGTLEDTFRFDWEITSINHPRHEFHAGKNYRASNPEVLAADLDSWLGNEVDNLLHLDGQLTKESLQTLIGRKADLQVIHIENSAYEKPYCHVKLVMPDGSLIKTDERRAA